MFGAGVLVSHAFSSVTRHIAHAAFPARTHTHPLRLGSRCAHVTLRPSRTRIPPFLGTRRILGALARVRRRLIILYKTHIPFGCGPVYYRALAIAAPQLPTSLLPSTPAYILPPDVTDRLTHYHRPHRCRLLPATTTTTLPTIPFYRGLQATLARTPPLRYCIDGCARYGRGHSGPHLLFARLFYTYCAASCCHSRLAACLSRHCLREQTAWTHDAAIDAGRRTGDGARRQRATCCDNFAANAAAKRYAARLRSTRAACRVTGCGAFWTTPAFVLPLPYRCSLPTRPLVPFGLCRCLPKRACRYLQAANLTAPAAHGCRAFPPVLLFSITYRCFR